MQLSVEIILSLIASAFTGAAMAWLGNRVMNSEILGHVRKHCSEIAVVREECNRIDDRMNDYSHDLRELGEAIAVLRDRAGLRRNRTEEAP